MGMEGLARDRTMKQQHQKNGLPLEPRNHDDHKAGSSLPQSSITIPHVYLQKVILEAVVPT
jgi:hypothetical protein